MQDKPTGLGTGAPERAPQPVLPASRGVGWVLPVVLAVLLGGLLVAGLGVRAWLTPPPASTLVVRPGASILLAVRDLARLETFEVHVEKVIDLTDRQSHLFGLVEASDAILLVAVGNATLGVDLSKVGEDDVAMDPVSKTARLQLPAPELLQAGLDEKATYVYTRSTSVLARRNEQLESQARREAVEAIRKVALQPDMMARARAQAERQLRALVSRLGADHVEITWRE